MTMTHMQPFGPGSACTEAMERATGVDLATAVAPTPGVAPPAGGGSFCF